MSNLEIHNSEKLRGLPTRNKEIILWQQKNEMINSLAWKLWISSKSAKKLSELKTITNISILKKELEKIKVDENKYDETEELNKIFNEIQNIQFLQNELKSKSRVEIASLKEQLEIIPEYKIASENSISNKFTSSEYLAKIVTWETFWDNLAWVIFWSADSIYSLWTYAKDLAFWIVKSPIDLYKIVTWKAETDSFKNV